MLKSNTAERTSHRLLPEAKHGSVLPLTQMEHDRLLSAYGGQESDR
ncbi:hypothetical protein QFZ32_000176 [Streptomyces canus]|uniref:Uncharacterized protein n=1 Tax=Streptomyces canus TaxID=58343 RepID=A0AAW8F582_9ACTN|nr:hypothetical protein [Streptomyces canus]MDQ1064737.1 hypothetical protein [Streptomyces canus]